jgi:hypothetical protein
VGVVGSHQLAAAVTPHEASERPGQLQQLPLQEKETLPGLQPDIMSQDIMDDLHANVSYGSSSSSRGLIAIDPAAGTQSLPPALVESSGCIPVPDDLQWQAQGLLATTPEAEGSWMTREQHGAAEDLSGRVLQQQMPRLSQHQSRPKAWAADYGHLDIIK